jgi:protein TonB
MKQRLVLIVTALFTVPIRCQVTPMRDSGPVVTHQVEPSYSSEARRALLSGDVRVHVFVDSKGRVTQAVVTKSLGMGLDEQALKAVKKYRFRPAVKDGHVVASDVYIEAQFRIFPAS